MGDGESAARDEVHEIPPSVLDEIAPPKTRSARGPSTERLVVRRPAELPGVELLVLRDSDRRLRMITQGYWISASGPRSRDRAWNENRYRGRLLRVEGEDIGLLEPDEPIVQERSNGPTDCVTLVLAPAFVRGVLGTDAALRFRRPSVRDPALDALLWSACRSLAGPHPDPVEREERLAELVGHAFSTHAERPPEPDPGDDDAVARAREILEARYAEPLRLHDVARACAISKFHLERKFRARFGVPIHQYLRMVRVRRAMERLQRDEAPSKVAAEVGFADQAHMTRVFGQMAGVTPGAYRRAR